MGELSSDLISQFVKATDDSDAKIIDTSLRGTITKYGEDLYVTLDGSEVLTPLIKTVEVSEGDRVEVSVKNHTATVTGNNTNPAIGIMERDNLRTEISQTAEAIRLEAADSDAKLQASIELTASEIRSEVSDEVAGLNSTISQTASELTTRIENNEGQYTELKQTIDGWEFVDEDGSLIIDGGSIDLTGCITWSDLASDAQGKVNTAQSTADSAQTSAGNAYDYADIAYRAAKDAESIATANSLPDYIKSTYIDSTSIMSPLIYGAEIYAGDTGASTYCKLDNDGFSIYYNTGTTTLAKLYMGSSSTGDAILTRYGAGDSNGNNYFMVGKTEDYAVLWYTNTSGQIVGFTFHDNGTIAVKGTLDIDVESSSGVTLDEVYPVGSIVLRYNHTSPAYSFGGSWTRISPYFLYAAGSGASIGDTGTVVTAGGTNDALYIKVSAWRRIS